MSAVTPACSHTHLLKSEHQVSFSFRTPNVASSPQPSALPEKPPVSVLYGLQSAAKLVDAGVSLVPTWLRAMLAIAWSRSACVAGRAGAGNADRARLAAARCVAMAVAQPAGSASPHAFFSVAGSPAPQPYAPALTSRHPSLRRL